MFAEVHAILDSLPVVAQVQHHTTRGATGETGLCIRGISIFHDAAAATANTNDMIAPRIVSGWKSQSPAIRAIELVFLGLTTVGVTFTIVNALLKAER